MRRAELCDISVQTLTAAIDRGEIRISGAGAESGRKGPKTRRILRSELHRSCKSKIPTS
jgi:hypothetical protein